MTDRWVKLVAALAVVMTFASGAGAQPKEDAPAPETSTQPADARAREDDGAERSRIAREVLRRQLQRTKERVERMERALAMLERGDALADVRAQFPELSGPMRGGDGRGPRGGGPSNAAMAERRLEDRLESFDQLDRPLPEDPGMARRGGPEREPGGPRTEGDKKDGQAPTQAPSELGPEQQEFIDVFLNAASPQTLKNFTELRKRDPEAARRKFVQMFPRVRFLYELRTRDPEMFKLRLLDIRYAREALESARRIAEYEERAVVGAEVEGARAALRRSLEEQYRVRGEILKAEITRLRTRLDEANREIDRREAGKASVVETFERRLIEREKERRARGDSEADDGEPRRGPGDDRPRGKRPRERGPD